MSILVPVHSVGITLNEVPDKVAFYITLGNCTQRCKGCHSPELWEPVPSPRTLSDVLKAAEKAIDEGANAIVLMGGTCNTLSVTELVVILNALSDIAPTCLYSGSDDMNLNTFLAENTNITWIKTGSYREELGGLTSNTTNQRFYRKDYEQIFKKHQYVTNKMVLVDCTHLFQA